MKHSTGSVNSRRGTFALVLLALVAGLIPAAVAQAKVKVKDGVYYQPGKARDLTLGYLTTEGGKITGAGFTIKFKTKSGKACVPSGYTESEGYVSLVFGTKKTKPKSNGKFTLKNQKSPFNPGLKATVTGKFKSSNKASFKATLKAGGCTAKRNFTKAVYTAGG